MNYTFFTLNQHFFICFRHFSIDFITLSLVLNRGSHYEPLHSFFLQTASQLDLGHIIDKGHSIWAGSSASSKFNARCRLHDPSRTVVHYVKQACNCRKRLSRFQTNATVKKSIEMCRNHMKRCRFGVQNGVSVHGCRTYPVLDSIRNITPVIVF